MGRTLFSSSGHSCCKVVAACDSTAFCDSTGDTVLPVVQVTMQNMAPLALGVLSDGEGCDVQSFMQTPHASCG